LCGRKRNFVNENDAGKPQGLSFIIMRVFVTKVASILEEEDLTPLAFIKPTYGVVENETGFR